jgi:hypothetical protein
MEPHLRALAGTRPSCFWLDQPERPARAGSEEADLAIAGGGFTGLRAALQAKEAEPYRNVVLIPSGGRETCGLKPESSSSAEA